MVLWFKKLRMSMALHMRDNPVRYSVVGFLFFTAIAAGVFSFNIIPDDQKLPISNYLKGFALSVRMAKLNIPSALLQSFLYNLRIFALITLCGLTIYSLPISILAVLAKGFSLGFSLSAIISMMGVSGVAMGLLCVVPANIIIVYCYVRGGVTAIDHAVFGLKNRERGTRIRRRNKKMWRRHVPYLSEMLSLFLLMLIGIIVESIVVPLAINAFSAIFY